MSFCSRLPERAARRASRWPGLLLLVGAWLGAAPGPALAAPAAYTLDPAHSFVQFELMHFGTSTIRGRFGPVSGVVRLDRERGAGEVSIEIDTASADTGLAAFDAHLRGPDLLDTKAHPRAWFVSRRLRLEGGPPAATLASLDGELTLRGISQSITLTATRFACRQDARLRREVCGGDFEAELRRSDYGIDYGLPFVGNAVRLKVQVEGVRVD